MRRRVVLILIILVAAALRLYALGRVPSSVNADEAAIGYNAYSIVKTGKDEYGKRFPLLFRSFDDYKLPVYVYLAAPSVAVFGLNDFSVRLPSAILGTLTVAATYALVIGLLGNSAIALAAGFLLAISPWHLQVSRAAYEANIAVFFAVTGFALLLKAHTRGIWYVPGFILLALSVWSYHSSRLFVPLMLMGFFIIYFRTILVHRRYFFLSMCLCVALCAPLILLSFSANGLVRARGVSALGDDHLIKRNVSWRMTDIASGIPLSHIYHNHRFVDLSIILKGYLEHFSPNYFVSEIVQGKYHAPGVGLLYIWELPLLLWGMHAAMNRKNKGKYLLFLWFFAAPLAASPTHMLPHPIRALIAIPSIQMFVAVGLIDLYVRLSRVQKTLHKGVVVSGAFMIALSFCYYLHQYYVHLPIDYALEWQYGHKEVVETVRSIQKKFDRVIVSTSLDQPYIFFLYYLKKDPAAYLAQGGTVSGKFDEERNTFDNYEFHSYIGKETIAQPGVLYVGTPSERPPGTERLVEILDPSGNAVYVLFAAISKRDWNEQGNQPYLN